MLDTGEGAGARKERQFFFEKQWCRTEGFLQLVDNKWGEIREKCPKEANSLDRWHRGVHPLELSLKDGGEISGVITKKREMN
jgi:hypothetical protein